MQFITNEKNNIIFNGIVNAKLASEKSIVILVRMIGISSINDKNTNWKNFIHIFQKLNQRFYEWSNKSIGKLCVELGGKQNE